MMISRLLRGRGQRDRDPAERHRQEARLKTVLIFIILPRNFRGEPTANSHRPGLDGPMAPRRLWQPFPVSQEVNERERRRGEALVVVVVGGIWGGWRAQAGKQGFRVMNCVITTTIVPGGLTRLAWQWLPSGTNRGWGGGGGGEVRESTSEWRRNSKCRQFRKTTTVHCLATGRPEQGTGTSC